MRSGQSENAPSALYFAAVSVVWVSGVFAVLSAAGMPFWIVSFLAGVSAPLVALVLWRGYVRIRSRHVRSVGRGPEA
ncbi:MAG: hypothetical protein QOD71_603 [Thermoleophilaceae bacterium]|jgi:hypothetical protein|nr:hypothetical protein [Thermoleophilaceae bacterium]